jgi:hypothetical protein
VTNSCTIAIPDRPSTASYGLLQLPDGTTVSGKRLQGYSGPDFERRPDGRLIVMTVPEGSGKPTPHSHFPRCELKENRTWNLNEGCAGQAARLVIRTLPASGDVVIGQIHQELPPSPPLPPGEGPRPPVELHYDNGKLHAEVLKKNTTLPGTPRTRLVVASGIPVGQAFTYAITLAKGGLLTVTVNDAPPKSLQLDSSFDASHLYFKAGNYCQDKNGGSCVAFEGLAIAHVD